MKQLFLKLNYEELLKIKNSEIIVKNIEMNLIYEEKRVDIYWAIKHGCPLSTI